MPHYDRAPITEALIDIKTEPVQELRFDDLRRIKEKVPEYPQEEVRNLAEGVLQFGPTVRAMAQQTEHALMLRNEANNQIVQIRLDGFTFSRLEPYQDWLRLRDEGRRLWGIYRELTGQKRITRIAVRYINQFNFDSETVEPEYYFNTYPMISKKLPEQLRDFGPFLMNLRLPQRDIGGVLVINQGNGIPKPGTVPIVLDFDLYVENPQAQTEGELWLLFEKLRERKNLYFEACITDNTRELIR